MPTRSRKHVRDDLVCKWKRMSTYHSVVNEGSLTFSGEHVVSCSANLLVRTFFHLLVCVYVLYSLWGAGRGGGENKQQISILTTYNGQCQLIQDVVNQRCANNDLFGEPARIATVDK